MSEALAALETPALIKNPPKVALVRQANLALGAKQANKQHDPESDPSRAAETKKVPSKPDSVLRLSDFFTLFLRDAAANRYR